MSDAPKVLVASPVYSGKDYIFDKWYKTITNLDYPNYSWLIVDNSKGLSYSTKLRRKGYKNVVHVARDASSRRGIANSSEYIRQHMIKYGYEYVMFIESDLIPPKNIIDRLIRHCKDVVGAVYEIGFHGSLNNPRRPLLYYHHRDRDGKVSLKLLPKEEGVKMINQGVIKTPACGLGCTLISRDIMEKYEFKYAENSTLHSDMIFYWELWDDGVDVWVDTDIMIPHFNSDWGKVKDR